MHPMTVAAATESNAEIHEFMNGLIKRNPEELKFH
jgi:hypothetical protein